MKQPLFRGINIETNEFAYGFGWCSTDFTDVYLNEHRKSKQDAILYTENGIVVCDIETMGQLLDDTVLDENSLFVGDIVEVTIGGYVQSDPYLIENTYDVYHWTNYGDSYYRVSKVRKLGNKFKNTDINYIVPEF